MVDVLFLFASPRYFRVKVPAYDEAYKPIAYHKEYSQLKTLIESGERQSSCQIMHKMAAATVHSLEEALF